MAVAPKLADQLARLALSAGQVRGMMVFTLDQTGS
jgi:hypothetical protein